MNMDIRIEHLYKKYRDKTALSDINLTLPAGSFTAILGPSGCGKTTLMRCLAGFLQVDAGTIRFGDRDVTHLPPQNRQTAMVFQNYALWPHMSVYDNIAYGLKLKKLDKKKLKRKSTPFSKRLSWTRPTSRNAGRPNIRAGSSSGSL